MIRNSRWLLREYRFTLVQQHHSEFVGVELLVELFGKIDSMSRIAKTDLAVFGALVVHKDIAES